jgi:transposase-like protein
MEQKAMKAPKTLQEAITYFADPERAFVYAVNWRWPDGVITCPRCGGEKHSFIKTRLLWFCKGCKKQFTVKVGTIFEDSPIPLDKWMTAMWMLVNCKNGISSYELAKAIGITQKSGWFVLQRLRAALAGGSFGNSGGPGTEFEADETFIGGLGKNMHKDRKLRLHQIRSQQVRGDIQPGKTAVMGILSRDERKVRATVVPNLRRTTLQAEILNSVPHGAAVYTDQALAYDGLADKYAHEVVNHLEQYVKGRVHTNGLENFWSLLKRGLNGTYVAVEPFHLFRYVDEQVFRYNNRKTKDQNLTDADRFNLALSQIGRKRLTFAEVTGKSGSQANA